MPNNHSEKHVVEVALQLGRGLSTLTYLRPHIGDSTESWLGRRVQVEVGKRKTMGVVTREGNVEIPKGVNLKEIEFATDDAPILTQTQLDLAHFVSDYYEEPFYNCIKLCLPTHNQAVEAKVFSASDIFLETLKLEHGHKSKSNRLRRATLVNYGFSDTQINELLAAKSISLVQKNFSEFHPDSHENGRHHVLSDEQNHAIASILESSSKAFLLEGVTGSGKTEVYLGVARAVLAMGRSVLFIVPEIALTPQLFNRMHEALGEMPALLHSNIGSAQRDQELASIRNGESRVIIGARSALFCPAKNLGLIVVDEEHDNGFKQDESPRYHARDVALWRASHEGARIVLGSATPSLECLHNVERSRLQHLKLTKRVSGQGLMPKVEVIDLRERRAHSISRLKDRPASHGPGLCILSSPLRLAIEETLGKGQQVILFLNRRGYASHLVCEACGDILKCPDCSISLTYHKMANQLLCHQCSYTCAFRTKCTACPDGVLIPLGLGTERVEKELQLSFPEATVARFDRESVRHPRDLETTLKRLHNGEIDILIGTQMIAKGHDFPNVTLVGVILADSGLSMPDFRASERSFQLLTQVAGRAGRRETQGRVIIQTFNPEHPAIIYAKNHDVSGFSKLELEERKQFFYPPHSRAALLRIEALDENKTEKLSMLVREKLDRAVTVSGLSNSIEILGPAPCANLKLRKFFRWQIFIKSNSVAARKKLLSTLRDDQELAKHFTKSKGRLIIDVDPVQML